MREVGREGGGQERREGEGKEGGREGGRLTSNLKRNSLRLPIGCILRVSTPFICLDSTSMEPSNAMQVAFDMA